MTLVSPLQSQHEELLAELTDIAYQALLRRGVAGSFLETELELWQQMRAAYERRTAGCSR